MEYDVMPSDYPKTSLVRLTLMFKTKKGEKYEKTFFFHRYCFIFEGTYYIVQKTFMNDFNEETLENELLIIYKFF